MKSTMTSERHCGGPDPEEFRKLLMIYVRPSVVICSIMFAVFLCNAIVSAI